MRLKLYGTFENPWFSLLADSEILTLNAHMAVVTICSYLVIICNVALQYETFKDTGSYVKHIFNGE